MLSSSDLRAIAGGEDPQGVDDATIQELMTAACRLYAARVEKNGPFPATAPAALTATEGMIATTAILRAVNVQLFELGLWQSWSR